MPASILDTVISKDLKHFITAREIEHRDEGEFARHYVDTSVEYGNEV